MSSLTLTPFVAKQLISALENATYPWEDLILDGEEMSPEDVIIYCRKIITGEDERLAAIEKQKQESISKLNYSELIALMVERARHEGYACSQGENIQDDEYIHAEELQDELVNRLNELQVEVSKMLAKQ